MDVMELRRGLMMQMAQGGKIPNLVYSKSITMETTATSQSKVQIQLPVYSDNFAILLYIDSMPQVDPDNFQALTHYSYRINGTTNAVGGIMRQNGTTGTDPGMCAYNNETGVYSIGGQYGIFKQGITYHILMFSID